MRERVPWHALQRRWSATGRGRESIRECHEATVLMEPSMFLTAADLLVAEMQRILGVDPAAVEVVDRQPGPIGVWEALTIRARPEVLQRMAAVSRGPYLWARERVLRAFGERVGTPAWIPAQTLAEENGPSQGLGALGAGTEREQAGVPLPPEEPLPPAAQERFTAYLRSLHPVSARPGDHLRGRNRQGVVGEWGTAALTPRAAGQGDAMPRGPDVGELTRAWSNGGRDACLLTVRGGAGMIGDAPRYPPGQKKRTSAVQWEQKEVGTLKQLNAGIYPGKCDGCTLEHWHGDPGARGYTFRCRQCAAVCCNRGCKENTSALRGPRVRREEKRLRRGALTRRRC